MKILKHCLLFFTLTVLNLSAMDTQEFIADVKKKCSLTYVNPMLQVYPLCNDTCHGDYWTYHISETHAVHPVKAMCDNNFDEENVNPTNIGKNFPNPQFWVEGHKLRISDDINYTNDAYWRVFDGSIYLDTMTDHLFKFDGINQQGISVACLINPMQNNTVFYVLSRMAKKGEHESSDSYTKSSPQEGQVACITLENNHNRIIYSFAKQSSTSPNKLYIKDLIADQHGTHTFTKLCSSNPAFLFKKIIPLGNTHLGPKFELSSVYLGLTTCGQLYTFWFDQNKKIHYAPQNCYVIQNNQKIATLTFLDIGADETYQCVSGLLPKIALVDEQGRLLIVDLTQKGNPTLYCIYQMKQKNIPDLCRITYHNGICGIMYYAANTKLLANGKYEEVYDNFSLISAANLFKNLETIPTNQNYDSKTKIKSETELMQKKNNYVDLKTTNLPISTPKNNTVQKNNNKPIDAIFSSSNSTWSDYGPLFFIVGGFVIFVAFHKYMQSK